MGYQKFNIDKCKEMTALVLAKAGLSEEDSKATAEVLLGADLFGVESHGIQRLGMYIYGMDVGRIKPAATMTVERDLPSFALIDAHEGMAHPISVKAMNMAIDKAKKNGFGMVIVKNSTHFGIAGYYSRMAAEQDLFGMCMTNTEALVIPTFGKAPMLGTNPIAVSMPADPVMFHMDISTAVVAAGKMEVYAKSGKPIPEGWCVDSNGQVSTDPQTFLDIRTNKTDGGILPVGGFGELTGGYKGYGISMLVEIMTGVMGQGLTSPYVRKTPDVEKCCHVFQAIDYGVFGEKKDIEQHFSNYLQEIRNSRKAQGYDRIYIHGEKEMESKERVLKDGVLMQDATVEELKKICTRYGIDSGKYLVPNS